MAGLQAASSMARSQASSVPQGLSSPRAPAPDAAQVPPASDAMHSRRPVRPRRLPKALQDFIPSSVSALRRVTRQRRPEVQDVQPEAVPATPNGDGAPVPDVILNPGEAAASVEPEYEDREVDGFGLYRSYLVAPTTETEGVPDSTLDQCDEGTLRPQAPPSQRPRWWAGFGQNAIRAATDSVFYPFLNATSFRLMHWFYSGSSMKSLAELDRLVSDVILAQDFNREDLRDFNATRESKRLDDLASGPSLGDHLSTSDGWHHADVSIQLPSERVRHDSEESAPEFKVPGLYYRKIMSIITSAVQDAASTSWNMVPHRLWWKSPLTAPDDPPERVHSEMYNSEAMVMEHEKLAARPRAPGDNFEIAIIGIMLWSDSTHLAQFGTASLWPIYLFFANQSKYVRAGPTSFAAHHLAYIPSVILPVVQECDANTDCCSSFLTRFKTHTLVFSKRQQPPRS